MRQMPAISGKKLVASHTIEHDLGSGIHSRRIGAVKKRWEAKGRSYGVAALRFM